MVVFTCSHCGESLKKKEVEKHYFSTRCSRAIPALTCVDCLKDFKGDEYIAHTSCVTEEERYSAKGFVSKPPSNKNKLKQEKWIHYIKNILNENVNVDGRVQNILHNIVKCPGVPQKKPKFLNFCNNTFHLKDPSVYIEAWEFLEKKKEEFAKLNATSENGIEDRKRKRIDSSNGCSNEFSENGISNAGKHAPEASGKKKKNKQHEEQGNSAEHENDVGINNENVQTESKKKRKSKSSFSNSVHEEQGKCDFKAEGEVISVDTKESESSIFLSKKEKKEKRKKEKYERQLLEMYNEPVHGNVEEQVNKNEETYQTSKKHKKHEERCVINDLGKTVQTGSKKKLKQSDSEVIENENNAEEQEISDVKPTKFDWEETVVKLLESKGELPLKRVEKKVVNEYIHSGVHVDSVEKVVAKFNKKILKMSRVKVKKDIVKLAS